MIGLGSNRLSVCRRGGMRVTQAGKGGMEWLAGGRMPSWASPYSAQATAYLQQHYAAYWSEIMAYGFDPAHAALIPYVNEDPDLVCSLMDVGKTRWLVGDGAGSTGAYILTNYKPTNATTIDTMFELGSTSNDYCGLFSGDSNADHVDCYYWNNMFYYFNGRNYRVAMGNTYRLVDEGGSQKMYKNGTLDATWTISKGTFTSNTPIAIFCLNRNNSISYRGPHKFAWFKVDNVLNLVPYHDKTQGNGMLDLVNAVFYPNAGTGQFTISETPAS